MANMTKLHDVLAWATEQDELKRAGKPSEWNQSTWIRWDGTKQEPCGTACCIAGKIALEEGLRPNTGGYEAPRDWMTAMGQLNGNSIGVDEVAMEVLELTEDQADLLFEGDNNLADLRFLVELFGQGKEDSEELYEALQQDRAER